MKRRNTIWNIKKDLDEYNSLIRISNIKQFNKTFRLFM